MTAQTYIRQQLGMQSVALMGKTMSDTPLTDAEERKLTEQLGTIGAVPADFARQLELQAKHGWARAAENDRNYGAALAERDRLRDELAKR